MKNFCLEQLLVLSLLQVQNAFCALDCDYQDWKLEILQCVAFGPSKNNIHPQTTVDDEHDSEDSTPVEDFTKHDWSSIKTVVLKNVNLKRLHTDMFINATFLNFLDLSQNEDMYITGSPSHLKNVQVLSLSESSFASRTSAEIILDLPNLRTLNLSNIKRSNIMAPDMFLKEKERFRNLECLDVSRNDIDDLSDYKFGTNLKSLNLSHNRLTIGAGNFKGSTNLRILLLSHSGITNIPSDAFEGTNRLTHLDLSFNSITDESLHSLRPSMTFVNFAHNSLNSIDLNNLPSSLEVIDLSYNNISQVDQLTSNERRNLRSLNLAKNRLFYITAFVGLRELVELDISFNLLNYIEGRIFNELENLKILNLTGNDIFYIAWAAFQNNVSLRVLLLRSNQLKTLEVRIFKSLKRLRILDLSQNLLTHLPYDLLYESNLKVLELSCNRLSYLPDQFYREFPGGGKISLHGNPWKCGCLPKILEAFRMDPRDFVDGSHPSCYVGEKNDTFCHDTPLNSDDYAIWDKALRDSDVKC